MNNTLLLFRSVYKFLFIFTALCFLGVRGNAICNITVLNPDSAVCSGTAFNIRFTQTGLLATDTIFLFSKANSVRRKVDSTLAISGTINFSVDTVVASQMVITYMVIGKGLCDSDSVIITVKPNITPSVTIVANPSGAICAGTSVTFTATPSGGGASPSFQWKVDGVNSGTNSSTFTTSTLTNGQAVTCELTSNATCANPATATSNSVTMTVNAIPTASNAGSDQTICVTGTAILSANNPAIGTGAWTITSGPSTSSGQLSSTSSPSAIFNPSGGDGVYVLRWTISNSPCASSSDTVSITVIALPSISNAGPDQTICISGVATLAANTPADGTGAWTITSGPSTSSGQLSSTTSPSATFNPSGGAGTYVLSWTISNAPCSPSVSTVSIIVNGNPTAATAGADQIFCSASTVLTGNYPSVGTGLWTVVSGAGGIFTDATQPNTSFTGVPGTIYVLKWTISNPPCTATSDNVSITMNALPAITVNSNSVEICEGGSVTLTASGGASYFWQNDGSTLNPHTFSNLLSNTTITVTGTDANNCSNVATIDIGVNPIPLAVISTSNASICSGQSVALTFTTSNNVASATVSWSRTTNGISSTSSLSSSGAADESGTLINQSDLNQQQVIVTASFTGPSPTFCPGNTVQETISVNPVPPVPTIISSEKNYVTGAVVDSICHSSSNLNFGVDSSFLNTHSAYSLFYHWSTSPDQLISYASYDSSHVLINFENTTVDSENILLVVTNQFGCNDAINYSVRLSSNTSPTSDTVVFHNISNTLVCLSNTADHYQWGYDDSLTLTPHKILGATFQDYVAGASFDTLKNFYWVMVYYDSCFTKVYFNYPRHFRNIEPGIILPSEVFIYPNPNSGSFQIMLNKIPSGTLAMKVIDQIGQEAKRIELHSAAPSGIISLDLSDMADGIYFIVLRDEAGSYPSQKIIKQSAGN